MKKLLLIAALMIGSMSVANAQSFKDLLKNAATQAATQAISQGLGNSSSSSTTTTTTTTTENTSSTTASTLGNLASSLLGKVLGTSVNQESIVGTWTYSQPAVQFTSEDLLSQAGGAAAASVVEGKLAEGLSKIGVKAGAMSYTFNEDKTFVMTIGKRSVKGTYELNAETKEITFHFGQGKLSSLAKLTMTLTKTGDNIDLVSKADKLLKLVQTTISSSSNSTLSTIGKLTEGFDGMMIGFSFTK
jgi:hypothetical protein